MATSKKKSSARTAATPDKPPASKGGVVIDDPEILGRMAKASARAARRTASGHSAPINARAGAGVPNPLPEITEAKRQAFLAAFSERGSIRAACLLTGVGRTTFYDWRRSDAEFAAAFESAREDVVDKLEEEAFRRAVEGWDEPQFGRVDKDQDGEIGMVRKFSDHLLSKLLEGNRPDKYNKKRLEHTGKDGEPLTLDPSKMSDEQLRTLAELVKGMGGAQ